MESSKITELALIALASDTHRLKITEEGVELEERPQPEPTIPRAGKPQVLGNKAFVCPTPLSENGGIVEIVCVLDPERETGFRVTVVSKPLGGKEKRTELFSKNDLSALFA